MPNPLDSLLPIRRLLIDGEAQPFRRDLNFIGAQIEDDPQALALKLKFGLRTASFVSGATLRADYLCLLDDNEDPTPSFVLPAPSSWSGQRIVVKRLNQTAASVELAVAGGALIDGAATYTLVGTDVAVELWSDGTQALVGPASAAERPRLPTNILVLGQSNAAAIPITPMGLGEISTLCGPDLLGWNGFTSAMSQVVEGSANSRANPGGVGTGQGPGLGQIMTRVARWIADETGETVRTIAQAYTSQNIAYFRDGSSTRTYYEDGTQHPTLNTFDYVVASASAAGFAPTHVVWIQGEADAGATEAGHFAALDGFRAELRAVWPAVHLLIVTTIGNGSADRIGAASLAGVRRAQRKLAATYPDSVTLVDTADMRLGSYWFSENHYGEESTSGNMCRPYEEVARRIFAALRGDAPLAKVTPLRRVTDVYGFDHIYSYRRAGTPTVSQWFDVIGSDHLAPAGSTTPTYVASDAQFGGRSVIRFDAPTATTGEELGDTSIGGINANQWTVVAVAREVAATLGGADRCLWLVQNAGFTARIGLIWYAAAFGGSPGLFLSGSVVEFTGAPLLTDEVPRAVAVTYDGTAGTAKLYLNGELVSTRTGLANVDIGGTAHLRVGSLVDGAAAAFDGRVGYLAIKSGTVATDAQIRELSLALIEEFRLEER